MNAANDPRIEALRRDPISLKADPTGTRRRNARWRPHGKQRMEEVPGATPTPPTAMNPRRV